jgi:hypothetical protein
MFTVIDKIKRNVILKKMGKVRFRHVYELVYSGEYLFNKRVVGLWISKEIWKEGFCYQEIMLGEEVYRFIFTDLGKFRPLIFSKRKARQYLEDTFSFVPQEIRKREFSALKKFDKPVCKWLGYPKEEISGGEGVLFITSKGERLFFPKESGKRIHAEFAFTLMHPLPPYACLFL